MPSWHPSDSESGMVQDEESTIKVNNDANACFFRIPLDYKQCNAGYPLETPGGLYRGPPSMLINVDKIKRCACETLNQVQCSITMNVNLL